MNRSALRASEADPSHSVKTPLRRLGRQLLRYLPPADRAAFVFLERGCDFLFDVLRRPRLGYPTCAPPTRSSRPSQPSGYGSGSPRDPGSRAAGIAMAFKLIESAQHRWRAVNSARLVAPIRAGAKFANGVLVERPDESTSGDTHAA
jgi:hypothetical protein